MSEREKQTVFLKRLLQRDESPEQRQLQSRIAKAERDEKCVRTAMLLVAVTGMLGGCAICYEAIFVKDFFSNPTHLLTRLLGYLALGSGLCWVMFFGYWLWHRALTNRLYDECRRLLMARQESADPTVSPTEWSTSTHLVVSKQDTESDTHHLPLPKAA